MKSHFIPMIALSAALFSVPALALDLHSARANGSIGEKADGFVQPLSGGAAVETLAAEVNTKRRQEYAKISASKGQPVDVVGKIAAQQIIGSLPPGSQYQDAGGHWQKK